MPAPRWPKKNQSATSFESHPRQCINIHQLYDILEISVIHIHKLWTDIRTAVTEEFSVGNGMGGMEITLCGWMGMRRNLWTHAVLGYIGNCTCRQSEYLLVDLFSSSAWTQLKRGEKIRMCFEAMSLRIQCTTHYYCWSQVSWASVLCVLSLKAYASVMCTLTKLFALIAFSALTLLLGIRKITRHRFSTTTDRGNPA